MRPAVAAIALATLLAAPGAALAADHGKLILESRLRFESVDQDGFDRGAAALTLRTRLGVESPSLAGFRGLVEVENVAVLSDRYNNSYDGKPFPVVPDPEGTEINRAQISWTGAKGEAVAGRQRIILGNARFVGNAGFRQNEQTFDAVKATYRPMKGVALTYAYIGRIHRVFGHDSPQGEWRGDSHLFQADARTPVGDLTAYGYLLEFDNAAPQSSATFGARLAGARPVGHGLSATYEFEYARQREYRNNPARFELDYVDVSAGVRTASTAVWGSLERLGGDGSRGFSTPLASLHVFQGWADVFLTTPPNGVRDLNLRAATTIKPAGPLKSLRIQAAAHDFAAAKGGVHYGREFDVVLTAPIGPRFTAEAKAARFDGDAPGFADRTKVWLTLEFRL